MVRLEDVYSLTDFQRNARQHIDRLNETGQPAVLTVNGRAELVVQSAACFQRLLDRLEHAEAVAGVARGLASMRRGQGEDAREALDALSAELGVVRAEG